MAMTKKEKLALEVAQRRLQEAEGRIAALFGNKPTNTFCPMITSGGVFKDYPLLPNANIKFVFPGVGNTILARIRNGGLEIMGDNRIEILPQTANVVQIRRREEE